ncbi:YfiR family protein [Alishewanella sp. d11]|uniref:YfiR family protein n=1 Tax=Alishewanella sp. d11 TaxID=3414030 RepID=UPI003BF8893B
MTLSRLGLLIVWLSVCLNSTAISAPQKTVDNEQNYALLQAAYLYNIAKFISWPEQDKARPLQLCLFGELTNQYQPHFVIAFAERQLAGRQISIEAIANAQDINRCDVVYQTTNAHLLQSSIPDTPHILRINAPGVSLPGSALFDLKLEAGRLIIYYNSALQPSFKLPINTALLRITQAGQGSAL